MERIRVDITESFDIFISIPDNKGLIHKKMISADDLSNILEECTSNSKTITRKENNKRKLVYRSPILPNFNGVHVLQHIIKNDTEEIFVLQRQKGTGACCVEGKKYTKVGLPTILFFLKVINGVIVGLNVMSTKDRLIREDSILCRFPLGNVSSNGTVCLGSNNLADYKMNSTVEMHSFPGMFLMMPSTHNYGIDLSNFNGSIINFMDQFIDKEFNDNLLKEVEYTYKSYVEDHLNL